MRAEGYPNMLNVASGSSCVSTGKENETNKAVCRYDLAAKCYRQALQSVKESNLAERERNIKTGEIQAGFYITRP